MLICNTRGLAAPVTGVQRYAREILSRFPEGRTRHLAPPPWVRRPFNLVWEQCILPLFVRGDSLLWSPANSGPLIVRRQVITVHDLAPLEFPDDFSELYRRFYRVLYPRLLPRIKSVLTVSEYTRQRLIENYGLAPSCVHAIPLGVDHGRFKPQSAETTQGVRARLNLPSRFILFLGTLSPRKNVAVLIRAWHRIYRELSPDVHLVIAGGAGAAHVFGTHSLPDLPPRTILTGRVLEDDIAPLIGAAEVFVFPSLYEGFGLPPLEAMACGTACITSNATSLPEVVGDSAMMVDPNDDASLADTLQRLLTDATLANEFKHRGLARAAGFSWDKTAAATWDVLHREMASR